MSRDLALSFRYAAAQLQTMSGKGHAAGEAWRISAVCDSPSVYTPYEGTSECGSRLSHSAFPLFLGMRRDTEAFKFLSGPVAGW